MAAAQLRFLAVLGRELVADAVEQLQVALAWVLLECGDERPGHGARGLAVDLRVRTRLRVLAAGPHDHIRRAGLGLLGLLVRGLALGRFLEEAHGRRDHAAHVPARVRRDHSQESLPCFLGQVGLLENALRRVDVRQVERGAGVARIKDGRQPHAGLERLHQYAVHLVVYDVSS